jgi:formate dehydrogenase subunit gamma
MANNDNPKRLISTSTFLRQLRLEVEMDLMKELDAKQSKRGKKALHDILKQKLKGKFLTNLESEIHRIKDDVRAEVGPLVEARKERDKNMRLFERMNVSLRIQHVVMAISCLLLIFTGLPIKFSSNPAAISFMNVIGGIQASMIWHRLGALGLIVVSIWHFFYTILFKSGRKDFMLLLPNLQDLKDVIQQFKYYLGFSPEGAKFGRFSYIEKFDYWAVYWGCVIMIGTGAALWSPELTFSISPKFMYDIAKEVHSDEALLATLAIVIWHFYNVHFNPSRFPGSMVWFHGQLTEHEMLEEHPRELEQILAEEAKSAKAEQNDE